jgi:hypothetical protein
MKILAGATAAAAGIGVPAILYLSQDDDEENIPQSAATSPSPTTLAQMDINDFIPTLMAASEALFVAYTIEPNHYEGYFRYRAGNLDGYANLYQQLVTTLDTAAQDRGETSFVESDRETRRAILDTGLQHIINNNFQDASANILTDAATWEHYARFFLREVLSLFMYTDAWIAVGYDGWPGMARGLERYRQPFVLTDSRILG